MNSGGRPYKPSKEDRKRLEDRAFISKVKGASADELIQLHLNHQHNNVPLWKKVVIARAVVRSIKEPEL